MVERKLDNYSKYYQVKRAFKRKGLGDVLMWEFTVLWAKEQRNTESRDTFSRDTESVLKRRWVEGGGGDLRNWGPTLVLDLCVARAGWQASFTMARMGNTLISQNTRWKTEYSTSISVSKKLNCSWIEDYPHKTTSKGPKEKWPWNRTFI